MSFNGRSQDFLNTSVTNSAFFPALSLGEMQEIYRVTTQIPQASIEHRLRVAMADVNRQLSKNVEAWQGEGFVNLIAVDASDIGMRVDLYKSAVYQLAKAHLLRDHQTFARREIANNEASDGQESYKYILGQSRRAVKQLQGSDTTNINVELL